MLSAMSPPPSPTDLRRAREVLGLPAFHSQADLRRAFREAAKRVHPDREGGDAERFHEVVAAFQALQSAGPFGFRLRRAAPVPARPTPVSGADDEGPRTLEITTHIALNGGQLDHRLPGGRTLRLNLPVGLRTGDRVRAGDVDFRVVLLEEPGVRVRDGDVWLDVQVDPRLLADGGRISVETPLGRRVVWITRKAGERGLVRLVGQGLPARGTRRAGHLFLRLAATQGRTDSAARTLLRRFAAAWAA